MTIKKTRKKKVISPKQEKLNLEYQKMLESFGYVKQKKKKKKRTLAETAEETGAITSGYAARYYD